MPKHAPSKPTTKVPPNRRKPVPRSRSRWWRRALKLLFWGGLGFVVLCVTLVLALRWINPPITGVMLQRKLEAAAAGQSTALDRRWCSLVELGPVLPRAVIAAEDQRFVDHQGFDFTEIENALARARAGSSLRGASTISQQVAKNVFLTTHRSWLRKGLELWFTVLIEGMWSKQRILEVHLNVAEWGPGLFGGCAAAEHYFGRGPAQLSAQQAASMAATLPAPRSRRPDRPGAATQRRARWVIEQMPRVQVP